MIATDEKLLKVYELEPQRKHATIFEWFNALGPGESFTIENDHDPKPLYYHMLAELGPVFNWKYITEGPALWRVKLQRKKTGEPTIGSIAASSMRKAEIFRKYGIDYCCNGKRTLQQAATDAGINADELLAELEKPATEGACSVNFFDKWEPGFLADYIYSKHHKYYYDHRDVIVELALKVTGAHQQSHPELKDVLGLISKLASELNLHFQKEEKVLFPYIKQLDTAKKENRKPSTDLQMAKGPLAMMEMEHEGAGAILKSIRKLTNDYKVPADGCASFHIFYKELEQLEKDLYEHIHIENNILFPKALQLEKELR
jgi:regulator of cell morphogenesis and NO signaling